MSSGATSRATDPSPKGTPREGAPRNGKRPGRRGSVRRTTRQRRAIMGSWHHSAGTSAGRRRVSSAICQTARLNNTTTVQGPACTTSGSSTRMGRSEQSKSPPPLMNSGRGCGREVRKRAAVWQVPNLAGGWLVRIKPSARARQLHKQLPWLLREFEHAGRKGIRGATASGDRWKLRPTQSVLLRHCSHRPTVLAASTSSRLRDRLNRWGYLPPTGDPLAEWLGAWLADPRRDDNVRKLVDSNACTVGFQRFSSSLTCGVTAEPVNCHAACSYSWISPPKTFRRRVFAVVRSVTAAVAMSSQSGGRRFRARCGRCSL